MTISPAMLTTFAVAFVLAAMAAASAQTGQPREPTATRSTSKESAGRPVSRAKAAPRGPSEAETRWMDRASAPSNAGGGGGGSGM